MYLKRHVRTKDGKRHVYYSLTESIRLSRRRVRQRRVLNLGELNTTQIEQWQRSIEVLEENGQRLQRRLFTDAGSSAPQAPDVCEVLLGSLSVRRPRQFGDCWLGCRLFEELKLDEFFTSCTNSVPVRFIAGPCGRVTKLRHRARPSCRLAMSRRPNSSGVISPAENERE